MTTLTTQATKTTALTTAEADANFKKIAQTKGTNYVCAESDNRDTIEASAAITFTLPDATTIVGLTDTGDYEVTLKNVSSGDVTITCLTGTDTIDGSTDDITIGAGDVETLKVNQAATGYNRLKGNILTGTTLSSPALINATGSLNGVTGIITEHSSSPASLTGASVTLGSIPSHVKRIVGVITGASASSGLINLVVTIGDSGGIETTGYRNIRTTKDSSVDNFSQSTTGFFIGGGAAAFTSDLADSTFELIKGSGNTWHLNANTYSQDATPSSYAIASSIGSKTLSSTLTQVQISTDGPNFDAGTISLYYYG